MIGYFLAVSMAYRGIGVVLGMPIFIRVIKLNDYVMAIIGCLTTLVMFIVLAFAGKTWMMFVGKLEVLNVLKIALLSLLCFNVLHFTLLMSMKSQGVKFCNSVNLYQFTGSGDIIG